MPETSSSDHELDPRVEKLLDAFNHSQETKEEMRKILLQLEREAHFAESCAIEDFMRTICRKSITVGETASAKYMATVANTVKQVRESRFPDLVKSIKKGSH